MSVFFTTDEEVDAGSLEESFLEAIEASLEGWKPAESDPLTWAAKGAARNGALLFDQASIAEKGMFKRYGEAIIGIPPVQAATSSVESIWTMVDGAGYTVPAGTQVSIEASGESQIGFITVGDIVIPPESTKATITLSAIEPGEEGNGLTADPQLVDSLAFVESIILEGGETKGGVDEEEEDAYLDRLVEELRTLSTSLILPRDFEIDARRQPGVARAKCVRNYNAETKKEGVALAQTIFPIDSDGEPLSAEAKKELLERQKARLLTDVLHFMADPEYTKVDVSAAIVVAEGFDPASVIAAVQARLEEYFSPASWGLPSQGDNGSGWINRTKVYRFELISEIDRVGGVDRVAKLKLAKHGSELSEAEELTLTGVAPLTQPGTFTISEA